MLRLSLHRSFLVCARACVCTFLKLKIYILIRIWLCEWVSDKKFFTRSISGNKSNFFCLFRIRVPQLHIYFSNRSIQSFRSAIVNNSCFLSNSNRIGTANHLVCKGTLLRVWVLLCALDLRHLLIDRGNWLQS